MMPARTQSPPTRSTVARASADAVAQGGGAVGKRAFTAEVARRLLEDRELMRDATLAAVGVGEACVISEISSTWGKQLDAAPTRRGERRRA